MLTLLGSCRIIDTVQVHPHKGEAPPIHQQRTPIHRIDNPHCTKEIIQFIKFLNRDLDFPFPYSILCFRSGVQEGRQFRCEEIFNRSFLNSSAFVIEICSRKKYIHDKFYLHHLCVEDEFFRMKTPVDVRDEHTIESQTDEEIEGDIMEIQKMLHPRKIVIVSHYNAKLNGKHIPARNDLINLLGTLCGKHDIPFVDPTEVLSAFPQEQVMGSDLRHYTQEGKQEFSKYMSTYLKDCDVVMV